MSDTITVERVERGFIVDYWTGNKDICFSLDELFEKLLLHYEGRSELFYEDIYGKVTIDRKDPNQTKGDS
jgi:hypothetical protein